ncbi:MAG: 16S rRNA (uracil(1498)-N(3))-methyltransferase [Betaproteobacteria bacterium]
MIPRLYCDTPLVADGEMDLPLPAAHHAARVLRLESGDEVTLFNGQGGEYAARLALVEPRKVVALVLSWRDVERESPLHVTLVQGLASADRMDLAIRKSVELGAAAVQPVATARSVARLDAERARKRRAHWQQIAIAACEQCGRNRVPTIGPLLDFAAWIRESSRASTSWLLDPEDGSPIGGLPRPASPIECLVGPEGGLNTHEAEMARAAGFVGVRAGPRVMRTETAGAAVLAAVNALWGDWR